MSDEGRQRTEGRSQKFKRPEDWKGGREQQEVGSKKKGKVETKRLNRINRKEND